MDASPQLNCKILIIDDQIAIHDDFRKLLTLCDSDHRKVMHAAADFLSAPEILPEPADESLFELDFASQGEEGFEMAKDAYFQHRPYAVVFTDLRMPPGWDGVETAAKLLELDERLQIVLCTAYSDYTWEKIVAHLSHSDRFLILKKPFDGTEVRQLALSLTQKWSLSQMVAQQVSELQKNNDTLSHEIVMRNKMEEKLRHASTHDTLTNLPNRTVLIDRLSQSLVQFKQQPSKLVAVVYLDLDGFKLVNDTLGHCFGDQVLVMISRQLLTIINQTISENSPETNWILSRLGGDEFALLLDGFPHIQLAEIVARKIRDSLAIPLQLGTQKVHISCSAGIVFAHPDYERAEELLRDADTAMYHAKNIGKNGYVFFDEKMRSLLKRRLDIEYALHHAIEQDQFYMVYQPMLNLDDGLIDTCEALVRWDHPQYGSISPNEFIPVAEETGLIQALGWFTLQQACRDLKKWQRQLNDDRNFTVAVNLSRRQLSDPAFVNKLRDMLQDMHVAPSRLILEITETAVMENPDYSRRVLHDLRRLGVHLHMDDFGTGYSSLSMLHQFEIDGLKIDRSFVNTMAHRRDHAAIVHAIIVLARNLNIEVIAEGIETKDQLIMLQNMEPSKGQGFLFSQPIPASDIPPFVRHGIGHIRTKLMGGRLTLV